MSYRAGLALLLACCLASPASAQDAAALNALYWQAGARETGWNQPKDVPGAVRMYEEAARQGHVPSMLRLGYLRQTGDGIPQDLQGGLAMFTAAARTGDADGQFFLAMTHAQGVGVRKDPATARDMLLTPAGAGHQSSQYALGIMLALGEGGPKREAGARRWLDKAASGPDRDLAARAADLRDKIDKNLFAPDNSSGVLLGLAAFILLVAVVTADGSGGGPSGLPSGGPSAGDPGGRSPSVDRPRQPVPMPVCCGSMVPQGRELSNPRGPVTWR